MKRLKYFMLVGILMAATTIVSAEDGTHLWLRYNDGAQASVTGVAGVAMDELKQHWKGGPVVLKRQKNIAKDGYSIITNGSSITISASNNAGLLYGAFHLLRLQQMGSDITHLNISEKPAYDLRILNHWDNPNGTVERGFAGKSIFLNPDPQRLLIYARANASVGINGTVLNNVNAKPEALSTESLEKAKLIADLLRPYGINVYLSVNFASPMKLGGLGTADPLDKSVVE